MPSDDKKRAYRKDMLLAAAMIVLGVAISGLSLTELSARNTQFAQATPPLQSTPGAETKPSAPAEPTTTGARPSAIPPQPAQPDAEAQKAGATPALPPAPAEKVAAPIQQK
jgi:type IV secretory pathway VirB10-like protein